MVWAGNRVSHEKLFFEWHSSLHSFITPLFKVEIGHQFRQNASYPMIICRAVGKDTCWLLQNLHCTTRYNTKNQNPLNEYI